MMDTLQTVLFVDDEEQIRQSLRRAFLETDICCLFAASAAEALEILRSREVWVVVSDNNMPGMTGIDFLSRVQQLTPDTVRIMMTAYADAATAIAAINRSGAFRFVTKPWDNDDLLRVVSEGLNQYLLVTAMRSHDEARYHSLVKAVELKDPYTRGHCERVADYAVRLAHVRGLTEPLLTHIRHGSILHD